VPLYARVAHYKRHDCQRQVAEQRLDLRHKHQRQFSGQLGHAGRGLQAGSHLAEAVGAVVCDDDVAVAIHRNASRSMKARLRPVAVCVAGAAAPCQRAHAAVGADLADAVGALVCDDNVAVAIYRNAKTEYECSPTPLFRLPLPATTETCMEDFLYFFLSSSRTWEVILGAASGPRRAGNGACTRSYARARAQTLEGLKA
jgi:hypothetical protein